MINTQTTAKTVLFLLLTISFLSCEKKEAIEELETELIEFSIKIVSSNSGNNENGDLFVDYGNFNGSDNFTGLSYNESTKIDLQTSSEITEYRFSMDDPEYGPIRLSLSKEDLSKYSSDNPFVIEFGHYRNQKVVEFGLNATEKRSVDVLLQQKEGDIYYIDWGDGTSDLKESSIIGSRFSSDFVRHDYETLDHYTITLYTTNASEVLYLDLNVRGNEYSPEIESLIVEDLPSLETLSLGKNTLLNIDETLSQFPNLKGLSLRFGIMEKIDLSSNTELEFLNLRGKRYTEIKNLENLTKLQNLGLDAVVDNMEPTNYPDLEALYLFNNDIEAIDVSQNPKLIRLSLDYNELTEINLENNKDLQFLYLTGNNISELDISNQKELMSLGASSSSFRTIIPPTALEKLDYLDLEDARLLDDEDLLESLFAGQAISKTKNGTIIFNAFINLNSAHETKLQQLVSDDGWKITFPN